MRRTVQAASRLLLLAATLLVLLATSAPPCTKTSITESFEASGTCGPPGTVVLSADWSSADERSTPITADGVAWLPRTGESELNRTRYWCPPATTFQVASWQLDGDAVVTLDGGSSDPTGGSDSGPHVATVSCRTVLADAQPIRLECVTADGMTCEATLVADSGVH